MPIAVHLDQLLDESGLTLTELAQRVDITLANLSVLKTNKARAIRFSTLEAICRELGCQPGDLLSWDPPRAAKPRGTRVSRPARSARENQPPGLISPPAAANFLFYRFTFGP